MGERIWHWSGPKTPGTCVWAERSGVTRPRPIFPGAWTFPFVMAIALLACDVLTSEATRFHVREVVGFCTVDADCEAPYLCHDNVCACPGGAGFLPPDCSTCAPGWSLPTCATPICGAACRNGGSCSAPDTCTCLPGWAGDTCEVAVCEDACENGGRCAAPDTCTCPLGWGGTTCAVQIPRLVRISPGAFTMGSPSGELGRSTDETPVSVTLTRAFLMTEAEVTQGDWRAQSGGVNPSSASNCGENCPVENVSWWSALGYLNALSEAEGLAPCYAMPSSGCTGTWQAGTLSCGARVPGVPGDNVYACSGYRLPTEAEWEFAARAGTRTATYGGDLGGVSGCVTLSGAGPFRSGTPLADLGWYSCNSATRTQGARQKLPNAWGLHDTLGNVWEWTWDRYGNAGGAGGTNPQRPPAGDYHVIRGGSWDVVAGYVRASARFGVAPGSRHVYLGLRAVRTDP